MRVFVLLPCLIFLSACAHINGKPPSTTEQTANRNAQKIIESCWAVSKEDRDSGVTSRMRKGALDSALCMRDHIIFLSQNILFKNDLETQKDVENSLQQIHNGTGRLYWHLNNNHDFCRKSPCGTMYYILHNSKTATIMEEIINDFYQKIDRYNYPSPSDSKAL